ncbi:MAG: putative metallopeptidase [Candidatus Bathyarchaeia archaeon]
MPIKYFEAPDVKKRVEEIIEKLNMTHIVQQHVFCIRSVGSRSERVVARIHGLERIWQKTLNLPPYYVIEVISERYDKLSNEEKDKTLIHELLHIPKGFSGGFRPHRGFISRRKVEKLYKELKKMENMRKIVKNF